MEVTTAEIFALLGPNWAGKTSTLESLEGLRRPDGDSLSVAGIDPARNPRRLASVIGVQLQSSALPPAMTVEEAMTFFCTYHRVRVRRDLIERLGLSEKRRSQFGLLSAGQQRRLALGIVVAHEPRVLFLDEPTAGPTCSPGRSCTTWSASWALFLSSEPGRAVSAILAWLDSQGDPLLLPTTHAIRVFEALGMKPGSAAVPWISLGVLAAGGVLSFDLAAWLFQWDSRASQPNRRAALAILGALPYVAAMLAG